VAHWDTRPVADKDPDPANRGQPIPGANDGASGVALLLAVADVLARAPPTVGVDLLFVDGEDYGDFTDPALTDVLLGSRHFARHLPDTAYRPLYGVVWDMIGDRDLTVEREPLSMRGAPEVVELVWRTAEELRYGGTFVRRLSDPIIDDHVPLLEVGLHVIDVIDLDYRGPDGRNYHHTLADTPDKVSARSLQTMIDVAVTLVRD
jgi:glutaminyl-peptide cyclotransferase